MLAQAHVEPASPCAVKHINREALQRAYAQLERGEDRPVAYMASPPAYRAFFDWAQAEHAESIVCINYLCHLHAKTSRAPIFEVQDLPVSHALYADGRTAPLGA